MKLKISASPADLEAFQTRMGYHFKNPDLLQSALIHPSFFRNAQPPFSFKLHFQRLEFLGDRLLGAILGAALFKLFPEKREGYLARAYMALSQRSSLVKLAHRLDISTVFTLGQTPLADSLLEDAIEAVIGSIFLDSDYPTTQQCVLSWFDDIHTWIEQQLIHMNNKGQLQEFIGERMHELHYELIRAWGPVHQRQFCMAVFLGDQCLAQAQGVSKQEAEEKAAALALKELKRDRSKNLF